MHGSTDDLNPAMTDEPEPPTARRRALATLAGSMVALAGTTTACRNAGFVGDTATPMTSAPASPRTTIQDRDSDIHHLRRLTFGPTGPDVEHIRQVGVDRWLDEQLAPDDIDDSTVEAVLADAFPQLDQSAADMLADYRADGNAAQLAALLPGAALIRHSQARAQLRERLVEFWGDHFNVPQVNPPSTIARIVMEREVFRAHVLGRFDDLLVASAQSTAMLLYLNNFQSSVGSINENYAREVLELHTVGVDGGYDEDDIVSVARLLTGWGFDRTTLRFRFYRARHDAGPVSVLGWDRPATGDPLEHGEEFLRHLARLPATARYVSRKLATRFVSDDPPDAVVEAMAAAWVEGDTAIGPVIRAMVAHPAFAEAQPKFNRPWDFLVQTVRSLDVSVDVTYSPDLRAAIGAIRDLGQTPFRWPGPDGYPDSESAWLNAGGLLARWNLATQLTRPDNRAFPGALPALVDDLRGRTADDVFETLALALRHAPLSVDQRAVLADLTGWDPAHVPSDEELDDATPHVAFVLVAGPDALYR